MPTKLGPHIIIPTPSAIHWALRAPIVLQAFGAEILKLVALTRLEAKTACRPVWKLPRDGVEAARQISSLYGQWGFWPEYTILWNEFDEWGRGEGVGRLAQTRIAVALLHAAGCKYVGDNVASTGTLENYEWEIAKREGYGNADFLGIHEYWGNEGFTTWHALRYRRAHDILGVHPPFLISECGRDAVEGGERGWRASGVSAEQYLAELRAYDTEIRKDAYVIGATPFTAGPTQDWANFDMDEISQQLEEEAPPMPTEDRIEAQLKNMWRRQGVDPNTNDDAFWTYALTQAKTTGKVIIPQHSPDGNYLDYSDPEVIFAYSIPAMWAAKNSNIINEGLPKLPLA